LLCDKPLILCRGLFPSLEDYYWTKFVFSNLRYPVKSANLIIGGKDHPMKLVGGYWGAWTGPINGDTSFKITEENGYTVT